MGILKELTKEYFGDTMRREEYVEFNTEKMIPLDMRGSILWADRDLEIEVGGDRFKYDKYFSFDEISDIKLKDGWRLPTFDEFTELYRSKTGVKRKTSVQISPYTIDKIIYSNSGGDKLDFETRGYYIDDYSDTLMSGAFVFYRMTSNTKDDSVCVFNLYCSAKDVGILKKSVKSRAYLGKCGAYIPVRLVKDKK